MLEAARERGVRLVRGKVVGVDTAGGRVRAVHVDQQGERQTLEATHLVLAAGPMLKEMARLHRRRPADHRRAPPARSAFPTRSARMPRKAPMLIWLDEQHLPWSEEERAALAEGEETQWLLGTFPAGVHGRPDGAATRQLLVLFNHDGDPAEPVFPLPERAALRRDRAARHVDHGAGAEGLHRQGRAALRRRRLLHQDAREPAADRPAAGRGGLHLGRVLGLRRDGVLRRRGAASPATSRGRALPDYAPAFLLSRYQDAAYSALLERWGDGGQL